MTLDKSSIYHTSQFSVCEQLLSRTARDKIHGKLKQANRAAKKLEHIRDEINSDDAQGTSLNSDSWAL